MKKIEIKEVLGHSSCRAPQHFLRKTNEGREYLCDQQGNEVSLTTEKRESAIKLDSEKDRTISSYEGLGLSFSEAREAAGLEEAITDPDPARLFQSVNRILLAADQSRQSLSSEESNLYDAARRMGLSDPEAFSVATDGRRK